MFGSALGQAPRNSDPFPAARLVQNPAGPQDSSAPRSAPSPNQPANPASPNLPAGLTPSPKDAPVIAVDPVPLQTESIGKLIQQVQAQTDLDTNLRSSLLSLYEAVQVELRSKAELERTARELASSAEAAPTSIQDAKRQKDRPPEIESRSTRLLDFMPIEELQVEQQRLQTGLQAVIEQRSKVETAITSREARRKDLPRHINEEKELLKKQADELSSFQPPEGDARIAEAQRWLLQAKRDTSQERLKKLELEARTYEAESELLPLRKELLLQEEKQWQTLVKGITEELNKRRESAIKNELRRLTRLREEAPEGLKASADRMVKRAGDWLVLATNNSAIQRDIETAKSSKKLWQERYSIMTDRIQPGLSRSFGGYNAMVGLMLRRQRGDLPDPKRMNAELQQYEQRMMATETLILELDDLRAQLDGFSDSLSSTGPTDSTGLSEEAKRWLTEEKQQLASYRLDASNYFDNLFQLASTKKETIQLVEQYRSFVDQHILWIRSSEPFQRSEWKEVPQAIQWLASFDNWSLVVSSLWRDAKKESSAWGFFAALWGLLVFQLPSLRRRIKPLGEQAMRSANVSFIPTAKTMVWTLAVSLPIPLLLAFLGWRLNRQGTRDDFLATASIGLLVAARYLLPLELLRQICRPHGLAEDHFGWAEQTTKYLRTNLRWLIDLGIPAVTCVAMLHAAQVDAWESSLGRLAFASLALLSGFFLLRILNPKHGVFASYLASHPGGWADRLSYLWYFGISLAPWALGGLSLFGFHYTAQRLATLLHTTIISLVSLQLIHYLLRRWMMLSRRKLVVAQAKMRLTEAQKRDVQSAGQMMQNLPQIDVAEINAQTMRLLSSVVLLAALGSIAFIWSGVLPAVGVLDSVKLWEVAGTTPDKNIPITLANLLIAIPTILMTIVAARNLPALLEIAILQHLPIENAVRYAIATLLTYLIAFLGIVTTFNSLGVRWGSIQWLVAALGVGLGFGLQEIFANFISGLILLFEQPIRVGDVITMGETTGSVSRIRMRATTITNWDRQELIIPNKDLITGRLLNWTLSDATNRLTLRVQVAFGTDVDQACRILLDLCHAHPEIMKDPEPTAVLEDIQPDGLLLVTRVFLLTLDHRMQIRHALLAEIQEAFQRAQIKISHPTREIYMADSGDPRWRRGNSAA
ncbi:MAG: mechanosensitive ion channel domain-containing protein [Pirellulaceae bacterium]